MRKMLLMHLLAKNHMALQFPKTYLIEKAAKEANEQAKLDAEAAASDLANWIRSN